MTLQFNRLTAEEIAVRHGPPPVDLTEYRKFLGALDSGDYAEVTLDENDVKRTIKRRLHAAAKLENCDIKYKRGDNNHVVFELMRAN